MSRFTDALRHVEKERNQWKKKDPFNIDPKVGKIYVSTPSLREIERRKKSRRSFYIFLFLALVFALIYGAGKYRGQNNLELENISDLSEASTHVLPVAQQASQEEAPLILPEGEYDQTDSPVAGVSIETSAQQPTAVEVVPEPPKEEKVELPFYTVQLIAYDNLKRAFDEIEKFKAAGFEAFVCSQTPVYSVCAGQNKEKAESSDILAEIKKKFSGRYSDAYVRKVSSPLPEIKEEGN